MDINKEKVGKGTVYFKPDIVSKQTKEQFIKEWIFHPLFKGLRNIEKLLAKLYTKHKKPIKVEK